ncbi:LysR family glycine cleavage system transcriptional activator [Aminobacter niigataensis]|uniref:LysR family glycine cleavage system transcriptional activator n=2 Tax=Aminobacter niigataensis TaxID=83265 RepID=A0ABR6L1U0_9HYPH|nr:LysR substrate-binding domain-containing protein [Aminobacter niigataensis]MBB4650608.1 LysR family glycine cleavage system transcriptional activator [Aminobacter niigataensis]
MVPVPLNPLRVFVVASRFPSFVEAAQKLHVTPGAISRQIKVLEAYLGVELYSSGANRKELTRLGQTYVDMLGPCIDEIENQNAKFLNNNKADSLRLACSNHFMRQWLLPRLGEFLDAHSAIEFSFDVMKPTSMADLRADVWIRYGLGDWPGYKSFSLMRSTLTPVCSPRYIASHGRPETPEALSEHVLLQSEFRPDDWTAWSKTAGIDLAPDARRVTFAGTYLAYQAALMGSGIALGRSHMMDHDLANGTLVELFPISTEVEAAFYLCIPTGMPEKPSIITFRKWIDRQVQSNPRSGVLGTLDHTQGM